MDKLSALYQHYIQSRISSTARWFVAILLAVSLGYAAVNISIRALIMVAAGALLFIFPVRPAKFLVGYLSVFPILDNLIPLFTSVTASGVRFGPQIVFRGGLTVLLMYYWLIKRKDSLLFKPARPMLLLLALFTLTTFVSGVIVMSRLGNLVKIAFWMFLLITVADLVRQGSISLRTIYRAIILSLLILVASILISERLIGVESASFYTAGLFRGKYGVGEFSGVFHPHSMAISLSMGLVVVLALATEQRSMFALLALVLFSIVIVISIMRTFARTGYTALISALLMSNLMFARYGKSMNRSRLIPGAAFIAITGVIAIFIITHIEGIKIRASDFSDPEVAGSGRIKMSMRALKTYAGYPTFMKILGGGIGSAHMFYGIFRATHNDYLYVLLSGGLVGMVLYFLLFLGFWKQIKPTAYDTNYLPFIVAGSIIAIYLVASMTNNVLASVPEMTYFSFTVGGAAGYYQRERQCI